jgi:hypothetical protein
MLANFGDKSLSDLIIAHLVLRDSGGVGMTRDMIAASLWPWGYTEDDMNRLQDELDVMAADRRVEIEYRQGPTNALIYWSCGGPATEDEVKDVIAGITFGGLGSLWGIVLGYRRSNLGHVMTFEATVPDRDQGKPFIMRSECDIPFSSTKKKVESLTLLWLERMWKHEFWESLRYRGQLVRDEHGQYHGQR